MFTPPPSPLPGSHFSPALAEPKASTSSTAGEGLLTPPSSPPEHPGFAISFPTSSSPSTASTKNLQSPQGTHTGQKQKKRKRYLPVLLAAIVLAVIAVSARRSTLHALSPWLPTGPGSHGGPEAPRPTLAGGAMGLEAEHGEHAQARRLRRAHHEELVYRQGTPTSLSNSGTSTSSSSGTSTSSNLLSGTAALAVYTAPPSVPSPALPVPTPFPAPFDISISLNVTTPSCVNFFNTFIQNVTFRACRPFGMLMSSSQQFQAAQANLTQLTAIVGGTCATDMSAAACGEVMDWHAAQIAQDGNCGADIAAQEALAVTALEGFRSYRMMRAAGCLVNAATHAYCYVEAVASLLPNDLYFWVAALGIPLPNATAPTCSACTQQLLGTYGLYANDSSLLISQTYPGAADKARQTCGEGYADYVALPSAAHGRAMWASGTLAALLAALVLAVQFV